MVTPTARRESLGILTGQGLSQRSACRVAGVSRRIVSYEVKQPVKDGAVAARLIEASSRHLERHEIQKLRDEKQALYEALEELK